MKNIVARKKAAFKELWRFPLKDGKTQYKRIRNETKKVIVRMTKKVD